jgi:uncharacterized repeat protein (TIGR03803 family)
MTTFFLVRSVLTAVVATTFFAGCSLDKSQDNTLPLGVRAGLSQPMSLRRSSSFRVVYRFARHPGGEASPESALILMNGMLYGTVGGEKYGAVYSINSAGIKETVYRFKHAHRDGRGPLWGGLLDLDGTLYGTTYRGGSSGDGVVFNLTTGGVETVLHSFTGGTSDGKSPSAALINVNGTLYGTTSEAGGIRECPVSSRYTADCGTVYSIGASGSERMLHAFGSGYDGKFPSGPLIDVNGALYGATVEGGSNNDGTVYTIGASGSESVLHSFSYSDDGARPSGSLIEVNGTLYGTTTRGGKFNRGTFYSISTSGSEKVLYSFKGPPDAGYPAGRLLSLNGRLYGTTKGGGEEGCDTNYGYDGCGTIYSVSTGGKEKVLYVFTGGADGALPVGGLADESGTLYGVTQSGGYTNCSLGGGCGTVFAFAP